MEIALRTALIFVFLYLAIRVLGRREMAQLTPFELILLVIIGDLVQQGVTEDDRSITGAVIAVSTIAVLILVMSTVTSRWKPAATALEGRPVIVVHRGHVDDEALRRHRMTVDDLLGEARLQGIGCLDDVALGVLEPEGKLSFVRTDRLRHPAPPESSNG